MSDISEKLKSIVMEYSDISLAEISLELSLVNDLGYDSLSFVSLIISIENTFNFSFDEEYLRFDKVGSFGNLLRYVISKVNENEKKTEANP